MRDHREAVGRWSLSVTWVLLALGVMIGSEVACAARRHQAVVASSAIYEALAAVQDGEMAAFEAGAIPIEQHRAFNADLAVALRAERAFNSAVAAWPASTDAAAELAKLVGALTRLTQHLAALPLSEPQRVILGKIDAALTVAVSLAASLGGTP